MSLYVFISGFISFSISMLLHVIVWRFAFPRRRLTALLFIFLILPLAIVLFFWLSGMAGFIQYGFVLSINELLAALLLHLALSSAYILSYPAVEAFSPSLAIVMLIGGSEGLFHQDLARFFNKDVLLEPRIKDLLDSGLAKKEGENIIATARGKGFVRCFILLRAILGLSEGKG